MNDDGLLHRSICANGTSGTPNVLATAAASLGQAHQLHTDLGDQRGQATTLLNSGIACRVWGEWGRAQQVLEQALQLFTDLGNWRG